jgi:hypothetical protein
VKKKEHTICEKYFHVIEVTLKDMVSQFHSVFMFIINLHHTMDSCQRRGPKIRANTGFSSIQLLGKLYCDNCFIGFRV